MADKWRNQAICCCTEPAQNRHRTAQNSRPPPQHPFTYTPFSPKVAPKRATQTPAPRINSTKSFLRKTKEKKQDRFSHNLKVANRSIFVAQTSPARAGAERSEREKGGNSAPGVQGRSPGTPLVTFVVKRKSPGVEGRSAPSWGCGGLQPPLGWSAEEG